MMKRETNRQSGWDPATDFRAKATFGVAIAAVMLLLPVAIHDVLIGEIAIAIGSLGIVFILSTNAWTVISGRCHQRLTLFGLVPAGMVFMTGVFQNDGIIGSLWCYPSIVACYCMLSARRAWLANAAILAVAIPMICVTLETLYAARIVATLCAVSLFSAIMVSVIDEQRRLLQEQLVHDPLTGLLNRLSFNERMQRAVEAHTQERDPVSLLVIDIDLFKRLNDTHGHDAGDRVLRQVGQILKDSLRAQDLSFRMGGEEFVVLLSDTTMRAATDTAERIRRAIAGAVFENAGQVTVSIGVSTHRYGEHWEQWVKRGDDRLYTAKRKGRNTVVSSSTRSHANIRLVSLP
jgi:diguanylate cyclase (GGDEF)-like protein